MTDQNEGKKSLDKIQSTFMEEFKSFGIKIPDENLLERKSGSIPWSGSGRVMFVFGSSDGIEFMEYYGHHRMSDGRHGRIFEDGRHEDLPELGSFYGYDPKIPGDKERKEEEFRKEYEKTYDELAERGLLSAGPVPCSLLLNSYMRMKKD
jgi:hypothetical protein